VNETNQIGKPILNKDMKIYVLCFKIIIRHRDALIFTFHKVFCTHRLRPVEENDLPLKVKLVNFLNFLFLQVAQR